MTNLERISRHRVFLTLTDSGTCAGKIHPRRRSPSTVARPASTRGW